MDIKICLHWIILSITLTLTAVVVRAGDREWFYGGHCSEEALRGNSLVQLREWIAHKPDKNEKLNGLSIITASIALNDKESIKKAIDENIKDERFLNETLLDAIRLGNNTFVEWLISDVGIKADTDFDNVTPLNVAANCKNTDAVSILIKAGVDPNNGVEGIGDAMLVSVMANCEECVKELICGGYKLDKMWKTPSGNTAVDQAKKWKIPGIYKLLDGSKVPDCR